MRRKLAPSWCSVGSCGANCSTILTLVSPWQSEVTETELSQKLASSSTATDASSHWVSGSPVPVDNSYSAAVATVESQWRVRRSGCMDGDTENDDINGDGSGNVDGGDDK